MFKEPELAPDLEWLLQSQDAPTPVLAEALVEAFFPSLFPTACALIEDREMAWAMTVGSIRDMLLAVYRYKAGTNPDSWARRIAMESFLGSLARPAGQENGALGPHEARPGSPLLGRFDALGAVPRLAVALSILQGLGPREIGQALGIGERLAAAELERAASSLGEGPLPEKLWAELARHRPAPVITGGCSCRAGPGGQPCTTLSARAALRLSPRLSGSGGRPSKPCHRHQPAVV